MSTRTSDIPEFIGELPADSDVIVFVPSVSTTKKLRRAGVASFQGPAGPAGDAGASAPFLDSESLVKGSDDPTKFLRFEIDGFTAGTTRVLTPPNQNATVAGLEVSQTFSAKQTFTPPANSEAIVISGSSLSGANTQPFISVAGTWNTSGAPDAISLDITNAASGALSNLINVKVDSVSRFKVDRLGIFTVLRQEADISLGGIILNKRGTTGNATAALSNGSAIASVGFNGWNGSTFGSGCSLRVFTTEAWTGSATGAQFYFLATPNGSTTLTTVATLSSSVLTMITGSIEMTNHKITGLATPTVSTDAATKGYVDAVVAPFELGIAVSDETTDLTTGTAKITFRVPRAVTLTAVRASINTVSSSGIVTVDINEAGVSILSTKLTIDVGEKTSTTAAVPAVISDSALADDAEITVDIDVAGTGAKGLKIWLIGT